MARCFGLGIDYRKIAEELNIAPATVRNHLQVIYAALGVSHKVDMARIILEAEE
ncbi:MAG TPA: LuxR C-terminal-related transcriptional regulator [Gallionellaceae bacterium]|nr:LuxR C-terminal-related transcriptional regulator [Gallionellaceae bacterium]